jgi:hypothetical protein
MDKKYVMQAFELGIKGRFDVLLAYYGDKLFQLPAVIVVAQIEDELGICIAEHSIYTLKKRLKKNKPQQAIALPVNISSTETTLPLQAL